MKTENRSYTTYGTFWVDLPNGTCRVSLTLVDTAGALHDNMGVFLKGTQVDPVSTNAGQVVTNTYTVAVTGGRFVLRLVDQGGATPCDDRGTDDYKL